jgi:hypothetical protein
MVAAVAAGLGGGLISQYVIVACDLTVQFDVCTTYTTVDYRYAATFASEAAVMGNMPIGEVIAIGKGMLRGKWQ